MADRKLTGKKRAASPVTITLDAIPAKFSAAQEQIRKYLGAFPCSMKTLLELDMIVEEIFINIAKYAYEKKTGLVLIDMSVDEENNTIELTFRDTGKPYDPLKKSSPDLSAPAEERSIGGLGIFLVRKYSDYLSYKYLNGENRLTIRKTLD